MSTTVHRPDASRAGDPEPFPTVETVDRVVAEIAADAVRRRHGEDGPPLLALELVRRHRLGAARLPVELGGGGWRLSQVVDLVRRLATADPDVPHVLRVHFVFVEEQLRAHGRAGSRWLDEVARGRIFAGAATELGTRPVGTYRFDTTLSDGPDGRSTLEGTKFYSTGSRFADYVRVSASRPGGEGVDVVVPADRDGVVHVDDWDGIGQRHTGSGTTRFEAVRVDRDEVVEIPLTEGGARRRHAFTQLYLHAIAAGILAALARDGGQALRDRTRSYSWATTESPSQDPQLLQVLGEISSVAYLAEAAVRDASYALDEAAAAVLAGRPDEALEDLSSLRAAQVKVALEGPALRAAGEVFNVGGASSVRQRAQLDRHWRNLRTLFSHNPTVYKARAIGDLVVNDAPLPRVDFF